MFILFCFLIVFQIKHWLADYPGQTPYMLGKFKETGWVRPLAAHCSVHMLFTFFIALGWTHNFLLSLGLGIFDFVVHFIMDRIKASPKMLGRYQALTKRDFIEHAARRKVYIDRLDIQNLTMADLAIANELNCELNELEIEWDERLKSNKYFWWSLGIDQMVHHITDIIIVFIIVGSL